MFRFPILIVVAGCIAGCSTASSTGRANPIIERDARLIAIARQAMMAQGFSLKDSIYWVRTDGNGWIVQVDKAPGFTGIGEPSVVIDATFFVKISGDEQPVEISSYNHLINLVTRPVDGK
jgi:hypothetical protein